MVQGNRVPGERLLTLDAVDASRPLMQKAYPEEAEAQEKEAATEQDTTLPG